MITFSSLDHETVCPNKGKRKEDEGKTDDLLSRQSSVVKIGIYIINEINQRNIEN